MEFEWDPAKAASNLAKHGVGFEVVYEFDWDSAVVGPDGRFNYGEVRWLAIGRDLGDVFYVIVFTLRGERLRVISARRANRMEEARWQSGHGT